MIGRGVNVLLVPDKDAREVAISPVEWRSARRNVQHCFAYSESGTAASSDLVIERRSELLQDYALSALDSVPADDSVMEKRRQWEARLASDTLRQTSRKLDLEDALRRI